MQWGDSADFLEMQAENGNRPAALLEREEIVAESNHLINDAMECYYYASNSKGDVPLSEVREFCQMYSLDNVGEITQIVKSVVAEVCAFHNDKAKEQERKSKTAAKPKAGK